MTSADIFTEKYNQAVNAYNLKNYTLAEGIFGQCISIDPEHSRSHLLRGICQLHMKNTDFAHQCFERSTQVGDLAEAWLYKGYAEVLKAHYTPSIQSLTQCLSKDPQMTKAYVHRGTAYMKTQKYQLAIVDFNLAIQSGLSTYALYLNRGLCQLNLDQIDLAMSDFHMASNLNPQAIEPKIELSKIYLSKELWHEAIAELSTVIKNNPSKADNYYMRGYCKYMLEDLNGAKTDFELCLQINPNHLAAAQNKALVTFSLNKYGEAVSDYSFLIKSSKDSDPTHYFHRGICYVNLESYEVALKDFDRAIHLNPEFAEAFFNRANAYTKVKNMPKACADLKKSYELGYEDAYMHYDTMCQN